MQFTQLIFKEEGATARITLNRPDAMNALSMRLSDELVAAIEMVRRSVSLGGRDVRLSPVGANRLGPASRTPESVRAELGLAAGQPMILAVARLARQKGLDVLLDAASSWQDRLDRPMLVVAGDGPEAAALRDQAADLGVVVQFLGRRSDVRELLAAADVVVLPSRWEGSPLSAHEALQAGRPLVATEVGGVPDLVATPDGPAALLVPAEDPGALATAITGVLDDSAQAEFLIARGLRRADEWPDAQQTVDSVLALYEEFSGEAT